MQPQAQQHTMHPDTYPIPSPRRPAGGVLSNLSIPAPQHVGASSLAVPAATEGSGSGGGVGERGELGGMVAGDVGYDHLGAGSRSRQEQVRLSGRMCV